MLAPPQDDAKSTKNTFRGRRLKTMRNRRILGNTLIKFGHGWLKTALLQVCGCIWPPVFGESLPIFFIKFENMLAGGSVRHVGSAPR